MEVRGDSPERFLNMCIHHKIVIWELNVTEDNYQFRIASRDFKQLRPLIRKTRIKIRIVHKCGLPFLLFRNRKRKLFLIGMMTCLCGLFILSQFVWHISISGNQYYTEEHLVEFLNENDIGIMMLAHTVDSDEIVSMFRQEFASIVWVSAYMNGCELVIEIKENDVQVELENATKSQALDVDENIKYGTDIVAETSGEVASIVVRSGELLVHIGDMVEEGDILVSGRLELYADYDILTGYRYVESDADIGIQTTYEYYDEMDMEYNEKYYLDDSDRSIYVLWNTTCIALKLWNPIEIGQEKLIEILTNDSAQATLNTEVYLDYDENVQILDLAPLQQSFFRFQVGMITTASYEWVDTIYSNEEVEAILNTNFQLYCTDLIEKKVEILENNVKIAIKENNAVAEGDVEVVIYNHTYKDTEILEDPEVAQEEGINE